MVLPAHKISSSALAHHHQTIFYWKDARVEGDPGIWVLNIPGLELALPRMVRPGAESQRAAYAPMVDLLAEEVQAAPISHHVGYLVGLPVDDFQTMLAIPSPLATESTPAAMQQYTDSPPRGWLCVSEPSPSVDP